MLGGVWCFGLAQRINPVPEACPRRQGARDQVRLHAILDDFQDLAFAKAGIGSVLAGELKEFDRAGADDVDVDLLSGELNLRPVGEGFWRVRHWGGELVCGLEGHDRKA